VSIDLLEIRGLTKHYAGITALNDVSLSIREGETHAIIGENGAGKSTLIKILTGAEVPSAGSISYEGAVYEHITPSYALEKGIVAIYQELNLIPLLTVAENIFFGCEKVNGWFRDTKGMNKEAQELFLDMGIKVDPESKVRDLGMAYQQIVEIVKAVSKNAKLLIMDEPTAPLTKTETKALYSIIAKLKELGVTIIYISHRLEEVFDICDRVTVMRDGTYIDTLDVKDTNIKHLMSLMVGRNLEGEFPGNSHFTQENILEVEHLTNKKLKDISFSLKKGEILGFGGLIGAGRTEVAEAIFGADTLTRGIIKLDGKEVKILSPDKALSLGIGLIPEDRKHQGLILDLAIKTNMSFSILKKITDRIFINKKKENKICDELKHDLQIKAHNLNYKVKTLSGGNQQKVVIAKILAQDCKILIFDEPTRGIDVGAKHEIYLLMRELTEKGKSIIMISSEMPELIGMSDRILVMHEGRISGELQKDDFSQEKILEYASMSSGE